MASLKSNYLLIQSLNKSYLPGLIGLGPDLRIWATSPKSMISLLDLFNKSLISGLIGFRARFGDFGGLTETKEDMF